MHERLDMISMLFHRQLLSNLGYFVNIYSSLIETRVMVMQSTQHSLQWGSKRLWELAVLLAHKSKYVSAMQTSNKETELLRMVVPRRGCSGGMSLWAWLVWRIMSDRLTWRSVGFGSSSTNIVIPYTSHARSHCYCFLHDARLIRSHIRRSDVTDTLPSLAGST